MLPEISTADPRALRGGEMHLLGRVEPGSGPSEWAAVVGHVVVGAESAGCVVSDAFTRRAPAGEHDDKPADKGCDEGQDEPPHADTMADPVAPSRACAVTGGGNPLQAP